MATFSYDIPASVMIMAKIFSSISCQDIGHSVVIPRTSILQHLLINILYECLSWQKSPIITKNEAMHERRNLILPSQI